MQGLMQSRPAWVPALVGLACLSFLIAKRAEATCFQFGAINPETASSHSETSLLSATAVPQMSLPPGDTGDIVVGLWSFRMAAKDTAGMADGTEVDFGYQLLHSDGTELLNSAGHASLLQSFCTGAWQQLSERHYVLNHAALSLNPIGDRYVGPGTFMEEIFVDESRNHFSGHFTLVQYSTDQATVLRKITGMLIGERMTLQ